MSKTGVVLTSEMPQKIMTFNLVFTDQISFFLFILLQCSEHCTRVLQLFYNLRQSTCVFLRTVFSENCIAQHVEIFPACNCENSVRISKISFKTIPDRNLNAVDKTKGKHTYVTWFTHHTIENVNH